MRLSFVIPALNERQGIQETLASIPRDELRKAGHTLEVIVVDGASHDGTADIARAQGARVLVEARRGYGRAYKTGFASATGDVLVTADADASYPLDDTPRFLAALEAQRLDFLTTDRFQRMEHGSMSRKHRFGNWVLSWAARLLFRVRLRDSQSGMWLLRRSVLDALAIERFSDGMPFSEELKIQAFRHTRLRAAEIAGEYRPRKGDPKLSSWRDGWRNLRHLWRLRWARFPHGNGAA